MHSFSSNAIFHAYEDNLKMRRNLSAEKIQIGVRELPDQVQQTHFQSITTKLVYFPKHALHSPAATRENDRTLAATEYRAKPAQKYAFCALNYQDLFFLRPRLEKQNANNETLRTTV